MVFRKGNQNPILNAAKWVTHYPLRIINIIEVTRNRYHSYLRWNVLIFIYFYQIIIVQLTRHFLDMMFIFSFTDGFTLKVMLLIRMGYLRHSHNDSNYRYGTL